MAMWTKVACGFDSEDETVNFGARTVAENDGSIYEACTRATLQPDNPSELKNSPKITASFWHSMLCIAVDESITIFSDEYCNDIKMIINFESIVTTYCLSSDKNLIYIALENGELHCYDLSKGSPVFNIDFIDKYKCESILQLGLQESNEASINLTVITRDGKIFIIDNVDKITEDQSEMEIKFVAELSRLSGASFTTSLDNFSCVTFGDKLTVWPQNIKSNMTYLNYRYNKVQFLNNYQSAICLRSDNCLSLLCLQSLLSKKIWDQVLDFISIEEKTENCLMILMKPHENEEKIKLNLVSFPDLKIKFTINVNSSVYLVDITNSYSDNDNLIFLEGAKSNEGIVSSIAIKAIEESIPDLRLQRLLRRHKFDEAFSFAREFSLDTSSIYQTKAVMLMDQLQLPENIDILMKTLEEINDVQFIYNCCNNAMTQNYEYTRKLLVYSSQRILNFINSKNYQEKNENYSELFGTVSCTLRKLETFEMINNIENKNSTDEWIKFSQANLFKEFLKYLSHGKMNAAALIWIRHSTSLASEIKKDTVVEILSAIPENLSPEKLWPWLRHFIPSITSIIPSALSDIINWGYNKTKTLEKYNRESWPDIGIKFAETLVDLLKFEENNNCYQIHQQYANKNSQFQRLMVLIQAMTDLSELKLYYKILLPLNTYLSNSTDVIHLLLNKVHIDEIPKLLDNFLQQYMINNSLKNDQILSFYIKNILKNSKSWWHWEKAPWDDKRLCLIINNIHNVENRLQQILDILKRAPVPWSNELKNLAEKSYIYDHPIVNKIRIESNSVSVKLILRKYKFAHVGLCSNFFSFIIKENRETMIDDIIELTKTNHATRCSVFSECINYYLRQGNFDLAINVIDNISDDVVIYVCEQIINVLKLKLNFPFVDETIDNYMEVLSLIESRLKEKLNLLQQRSIKWVDSLKTISCLQNLYKLRKEFGIFTTIVVYYTKKEEILENWLVQINNDDDDSNNLKDIYKKIQRITSILGLSEFYGVYRFYKCKENSVILKNFILKQLNNHTVILPEECQQLNEICLDLVSEVEDDLNLSISLKKLISKNMAYCEINELIDVLYCKSQIDAYNEAVSQFVVDENDENSPKTRTTIDWNLCKIYKDPSISSGNKLLPLLQELFKIFNHYKINAKYNLQDTTLDANEMKNASEKILGKAQAIQNEHQDFALLKIINGMVVSLSSFMPESDKVTKDIQNVLSHCTSMMLKKVIGGNSFDLQLGLVCLFTMSEFEALKILNSMSRLFQADQKRSQIIQNLGYEYCRLTENNEQKESFNSMRIYHEWAKKLYNYGVSSKEVFSMDVKIKSDILQRIMTSQKPNIIDTLHDFCLNFGLNSNDVYLNYLEILLTSWEPKLDGQNCPKIDENDVKNLSLECKKIANKITEEIDLKKFLLEIIKKINFYNYEIFSIIYDLSEEKNIVTTSHLLFFKNYTRISVASTEELDEWSNFIQEEKPLPVISKYRLPFLPNNPSQIKIIMREINIKNYDKWLTTSRVFKISDYHICTTAVKAAIDDAYKSLDINKNSWSIHPKNSALLKEIKKCIECMRGENSHYYATASLYYAVNNTPPGADQVEAAKECFNYVKNLPKDIEESCRIDAEKKRKIEEKYRTCVSKHILYSNGLGFDKYIKQIDDPEQLVRALYKDESIPQRYKSALKNRPDINLAVNNLNKIHDSINLVKIQLELLEEWLQPDFGDIKNNESIINHDNLSSDSFTKDTTFIIDDNLLRACYVVGSGDYENFTSHLISIGLTENLHGPGVRFRALRVVQSITDEKNIQELSKMNSKQFNQHLKSLQYLNDLQGLGIGYSIDGFESCSKEKLIQVLLSNQYCSVKSLRLVPQIFVDFNIDNSQLLNLTLEKMIKFSMIKEIKKTLAMLGSNDHFFNYPGYISAWQVVVSNSFDKLDSKIQADSIDNFTETLQLLHGCPVINKLQFSDIISFCFRSKQLHFAAALLPFVGDNEKELIVKKILDNNQSKNVINKLTELAQHGVLIVHQSLLMLEETNSSIQNE